MAGKARNCRAKMEQIEKFYGLLPESHGQNLACAETQTPENQTLKPQN